MEPTLKSQSPKQRALENLRKEIGEPPYEGAAVLTLTEHKLIGSTMPGTDSLEQNIPISLLLGGSDAETAQTRISFLEEQPIQISYKNTDIRWDEGSWYIKIPLRNPAVPISLENINYDALSITQVRGLKLLDLSQEEKRAVIERIFREKNLLADA